MIGAASNLYEQLFNESPSPRCLTDMKGNFVLANYSFQKVFGLDGDEMELNKYSILSIVDTTLSEINKSFQEEHQKFIQGFGCETGKVAIINGKGEKIKLDFIRKKNLWGDRELIGYEWNDVTEKVDVIKSYRIAAESVSLAAEINHLGVWEFEFDSQLFKANKRMFEIFGLEKEELISDRNLFKNLIPAEQIEKFILAWQKGVESKKKFYSTIEIENPKTGKRILQIHGKCLYDSFGNPWKYLGINMDVTYQKSKEEEILRDSARLQSLLDSQSNLIIRINKAGILTFCNQSFRRMFKHSEKCASETYLQDFLNKDDTKTLLNVIDTCLKKPGKSIVFFTSSREDSEEQFKTEWEFTAIPEFNSTDIEIQGVGKDISEKYQLNLKVDETQGKLSSLLNNFNDVSIWSIDDEFNLTASNNHFQEEFLKVHGNKIKPGDNILELIRPEMKQYWQALSEEVLNKGAKTIQYELDGRFFEVSLSPVKINNLTKGLTAYGRDITDRKLGEDALKLSEERLQFAVEGNEYVVWDLLVPEGKIEFSDSFLRIFNFSNKKIIETLDVWSNIVHPDDLASIKCTFEKIVSGEISVFSSEFRITNEEGQLKWVLNRGKVYEKDEKGTALRIIGILSDISERKRIETQNEDYINKLEKFAHLTSHSLRRPLANIIGIATLLKEETLSQAQQNNIILEMRKSAFAMDDVIKDMSDAISFAQVSKTSSGFPKFKSIWFIDDDLINNMLSERLMKRVLPKVQSKSYTNAEEALTIILNNDEELPDLIFLDINMPVMNGWEFLDALTIHKISIPIFMLTSSIDPRDQEKAVAYAQVNDFISKPLREERLKLIVG
jgi:PAS domain S-box-containing protein